MYNVTCHTCGEAFEAKRRHKKYCSRACSPSVSHPCADCGTRVSREAKRCTACSRRLRQSAGVKFGTCAGCGKTVHKSSTSAAVQFCLDCRRAGLAPQQQRASRPGAEKWKHGTATSYDKRGCRCFQCREAKRLKELEYRGRRKSEGRPVTHKKKHAGQCERCGESFLSRHPDQRFCSRGCGITAANPRVRQRTTAVEVWRPPAIKTPGRRWKYANRRRGEFKPRRTPLNGSLFVYGPCTWCDEPFMALAGDWERRSLYCSSRCARNAGRARRGRFLVPPKVRQAIYERDDWTCQLCGEAVDPIAKDMWRATLDHITPQSHQLVPDHSPDNLQLAHLWCNSVKGDERYHTAEDLRIA